MGTSNIIVDLEKAWNMKLLMFEEKNRKATFKRWVFKPSAKCSAAKLAEAGFFFVGNKVDKDAVQCFYCSKLLDSWDPDDDPWSEHLKHSSSCLFAKNQRKEDDYTGGDYVGLLLQIDLLKHLSDTLLSEADVKTMNDEIISNY